MLGVCDGYDTVEAVSENGIDCTTSNCLPFAFAFPVLALVVVEWLIILKEKLLLEGLTSAIFFR